MASGGDGSAPVYGELIGQASGGRPRTARTGDQAAGLVTDPTSSPEMKLHNATALAAQAAHNSGAADQGGGLSDPEGLLGTRTGSGTGGTWADPSFQGRR